MIQPSLQATQRLSPHKPFFAKQKTYGPVYILLYTFFSFKIAYIPYNLVL